MDMLRERGMQPFKRQIAFALYSPDLIQGLEATTPPDRDPESQASMGSEARMFDQMLAHQTLRWADACMYNASEDLERGEEERTESWLLQAAKYGHAPALEALPVGFWESTAPIDVARRTRLLLTRGQRVAAGQN